ncbi:MAG: AraC family transcriptional regulator [Bacillota bacterium]
MYSSSIKADSKYYKEYQKRINLVLDYIDNNFDKKLSVEILADVACFSPYHFHRIFHSIVGENVSVYLKKIRLSKAAYKLLYSTELTVTDIAFQCGFSSLSDFSRSFKGYYGTSPKSFFRDIKFKPLLCERSELFSYKPSVEEIIISTIRCTSVPDLSIAYIRCMGLSKWLENKKIENAFKKLFKWGMPRGIIDEKTSVSGITLDSPEVMALEECRYDAATGEIPTDFHIPIKPM